MSQDLIGLKKLFLIFSPSHQKILKNWLQREDKIQALQITHELRLKITKLLLKLFVKA